MTFKILTDETKKVIFRSNMHPATKDAPNYHLDQLCGEDVVQVVKSCHDNFELNIKEHLPSTYTDFSKLDPTNVEDHPSFSMPTFDPVRTVLTNPSDLVGRTFLLDEQDDGQQFHAAIVECINDHDDQLSQDPQHIKF